jgi:hypothetical protein
VIVGAAGEPIQAVVLPTATSTSTARWRGRRAAYRMATERTRLAVSDAAWRVRQADVTRQLVFVDERLTATRIVFNAGTFADAVSILIRHS